MDSKTPNNSSLKVNLEGLVRDKIKNRMYGESRKSLIITVRLSI